MLDEPKRYGAVVHTVHELVVQPTRPEPFMVNVDGLRMLACGSVHVLVSGRVNLIAGRGSIAASQDQSYTSRRCSLHHSMP
jgi:hypothetical protein